DEGWLVVSGRRGNFAPCDDLSVYDLATGAAYRFRACAYPGTNADGTVDTRASHRVATDVVETGRVPLEPLREAAWAILSAPWVQRKVVRTTSLHRERPVFEIGRNDLTGFAIGDARETNYNATLSVRWTTGTAGEVFEDRLPWPDNVEFAARDHAVRLLALAEARMEPGCAPAPLPRWLSRRSDPVTDPPGGEAMAPPERHRRLAVAVAGQRKRGRCPPR
ncbi:MAG: hypothetical protein AAF721_39315, partial [Myxococcota bacterium]